MQSINLIKRFYSNRGLLIFLACICAIMPLYISDLSDSLGKIFLLLLLISIYQLFNRETDNLNQAEKIAIIGALVYACIFIATFLLLSKINQSEIWRMESAGFILVVTLFFWIAIKHKQRKNFIEYVAISSLLGAMSLFFLEIVNVNDFASYRYSQLRDGSRGLAAIGFIVPITAVLFLVLSLQKKSKLYFLFFIVMMILSALNKSRTSLVILLFPMLLIFLNVLFSKKIVSKKHKSFVIIFLCLSVAFVTVIAKDRIYQISKNINLIFEGNYNSSLGKRAAMFDFGVQLVKQEPVFGIGAGNYKKELNKVIDQSNYVKKIKVFSKGVSQLHNQYIMTWILSGIIGVLSLLFFLFYPVFFAFFQYRKNKKDIYDLMSLLSIIGVFFGISVAMFFGAIFTYTYTTIFFCFAMYSFVAFLGEEVKQND